MLIERIGVTPLKGGRHMTHDLVDLTTDGPVGDRVFCLVDRSRGRVEDSWVGRTLRVGEATVRIRRVVPRCAVVDANL